MAEKKTKFFTYKGLPLVRCKNTIYYGDMSSDYVAMLQILSTKKVGDLEVADRIRVQMISTDETQNPVERIVKTSEKDGLYNALDIAQIWLQRAAKDE